MTNTKSQKPEITADMGPQAMFEAAYWGVTEQGCQALQDSACVYLTPDLGEGRPALRCALGHTMTVEAARNLVTNNIGGMNQYTVNESDVGFLLDPDSTGYTWMPRQVARNIGLCIDMQQAHDEPTDSEGDFMTAYHAKMKAVSLKHGLVMPEGGAS